MKTNRSSSIAKKNMRKKGWTENRPEQLLLKEILEYHVAGTVTTEVKLKNLKAIGAIDLTGLRAPRIDIVLETLGQIFLIRVNGKSHDTDKRLKYDRAQKLFLEMQKKPYTVIDVSYVRHELLFERNQRKLTFNELLQIYVLLVLHFASYGITFNYWKTANWLENSQHRIDR